MLQKYLRNKNISRKIKLILKNTIIDKSNIRIRNQDTNRERQKQINIFERKLYRRIMGPVYDKEREGWRILTNREIHAMVIKRTVAETIRLNRLCWFGHVQRMEENRIPNKSFMYEFGNNKAERQTEK